MKDMMYWTQKKMTAGHNTCDGIQRRNMYELNLNMIVEKAAEKRASPRNIIDTSSLRFNCSVPLRDNEAIDEFGLRE